MEQNYQHFREHLANLLDQEIGHARELCQSLEREHQSLTHMDDKRLREFAGAKQKLIDNLQLATRNRIAHLQAHDFTASTGGVRQCLAETDTGGMLRERFDSLSELARRCFQENRQIGQLINRRTQFISQALNSLTPGGGLQAVTYEEDGSRGQYQAHYRSVSV